LWLTESLFERQRSKADDIQGVLIAGGSTGAFDTRETASSISRGGSSDAWSKPVGMPVIMISLGPAENEAQSIGGGFRMTVQGAEALSHHASCGGSVG
jgi:hypothetical protein